LWLNFSDGFSFLSSFALVVLTSWSGYFLLGILLGLSLLLATGSIYQAAIQSLHFHFFILKIQKYFIHFALWHFPFGLFSIDLDIMERLHLIKIVELH
jgi:hypothetical protein